MYLFCLCFVCGHVRATVSVKPEDTEWSRSPLCTIGFPGTELRPSGFYALSHLSSPSVCFDVGF